MRLVIRKPAMPSVLASALSPPSGGGFWGAIGAINVNFGVLGYLVVGTFLVSWLISFVVSRAKGYDAIGVASG